MVSSISILSIILEHTAIKSDGFEIYEKTLILTKFLSCFFSLKGYNGMCLLHI